MAGASLNAPALIQVRTRLTPHGGVSIDGPERWVSVLRARGPGGEEAGGGHHLHTPAGLKRYPTVAGWPKRSYEEVFGAKNDGDGKEGE